MPVFYFVQPRGKEREGRDGDFLEFAGEGRYKENRQSDTELRRKVINVVLRDHYVELINEQSNI